MTVPTPACRDLYATALAPWTTDSGPAGGRSFPATLATACASATGPLPTPNEGRAVDAARAMGDAALFDEPTGRSSSGLGGEGADGHDVGRAAAEATPAAEEGEPGDPVRPAPENGSWLDRSCPSCGHRVGDHYVRALASGATCRVSRCMCVTNPEVASPGSLLMVPAPTEVVDQ